MVPQTYTLTAEQMKDIVGANAMAAIAYSYMLELPGVNPMAHVLMCSAMQSQVQVMEKVAGVPFVNAVAREIPGFMDRCAPDTD